MAASARSVLLAALESLDEVAERNGEAVRTYLTVAWAHQVEGRTVIGWNSTDDPRFVTTALLREVADAIECDEDDEDEGDE